MELSEKRELAEKQPLPQEVSFEVFRERAQITPLINHGRAASVRYLDHDCGFVDALGMEGLRQAHRAEVNNALYAASPGAPEFLSRPPPSRDALASYAELEAKHPEAYAKVMGEACDMGQCSPPPKTQSAHLIAHAVADRGSDANLDNTTTLSEEEWMRGQVEASEGAGVEAHLDPKFWAQMQGLRTITCALGAKPDAPAAHRSDRDPTKCDPAYDAVLAGLRLLQTALENRLVIPGDGDIGDILTNGQSHAGLGPVEIDDLVEDLQFGTIQLLPGDCERVKVRADQPENRKVRTSEDLVREAAGWPENGCGQAVWSAFVAEIRALPPSVLQQESILVLSVPNSFDAEEETVFDALDQGAEVLGCFPMGSLNPIGNVQEDRKVPSRMRICQIWLATPVDYLSVHEGIREGLVDSLLDVEGVSEVEHYSEINVRCDIKSDQDIEAIREVTTIRSQVEEVFRRYKVWPEANRNTAERKDNSPSFGM